MKNALLLLGLAALPFVAGPAAAPTRVVSKLDGTMWTLSTLAASTPAGHTRVTLEFEAGRIQGTDGCNQYSGPYSTLGASLQIGPDVISTQMACPAEVMQLAGSYMNVLLAVKSYRVNGAELQLMGAASKVVATFAAQSQSLAGAWRVTGINNGRQAIVSVLQGSRPTLEFSPTGAISGFGGCNHYSATYTLTHNTLSLTPPVSTRKSCAQPAGVMEQEHDLLQALQSVSELRQQANRLELRRADGALALSLTRD
jgi:heat shock protein HslJ